MSQWFFPTEDIQPRVVDDKVIFRIFLEDKSYRSFVLNKNVSVCDIIEKVSLKIQIQRQKTKNLGLYLRTPQFSWRLSSEETPLQWIIKKKSQNVCAWLYLSLENSHLKKRKNKFVFLKSVEKKLKDSLSQSLIGEITFLFSLPETIKSCQYILCYCNSTQLVSDFLSELNSFLDLKNEKKLVIRCAYLKNDCRSFQTDFQNQTLRDVLQKKVGWTSFSIRVLSQKFLQLAKVDCPKKKHKKSENSHSVTPTKYNKNCLARKNSDILQKNRYTVADLSENDLKSLSSTKVNKTKNKNGNGNGNENENINEKNRFQKENRNGNKNDKHKFSKSFIHYKNKTKSLKLTSFKSSPNLKNFDPKNKKLNYSFTEQANLEGKLVQFHKFNRTIMDHIVDLNKQFLKKYGFYFETKGNLGKIEKNFSILEEFKFQKEDYGSNISIHTILLKGVIDDKIIEYMNFSIEWIRNSFDLGKQTLKWDDLEKIQKQLKKCKPIQSNRGIIDGFSLTKDLISLRKFFYLTEEGVLGLIRQDLAVYWFDTKNELEMASEREILTEYGVRFLSKPLKKGKISIITAKSKNLLKVYFVLTANFIQYIILNEEEFESKMKKRVIDCSIPIVSLNISRNIKHKISKKKDRKLPNFGLSYGSKTLALILQSEDEKENWMRLISIMQARALIQKLIKINLIINKKNFFYIVIPHSFIFSKKFIFSFDVKCYSSMWHLKKNFDDFIEFRNNLHLLFPNIIFPKIKRSKKKIVEKVSINQIIHKHNDREHSNNKNNHNNNSNNNNNNNNNNNHNNNNNNNSENEIESKKRIKSIYLESFLRAVLSNNEIAKSKITFQFLGLYNIFNPILMNDCNYLKFLLNFDDKIKTQKNENGENPLYYCIKNNYDQKIIKILCKNIPDLYKEVCNDHLNSLLLAIELDQLETIKTFNKVGIDFNYAENKLNGITSLLFAITKKKIKIAKYLIENCNCNVNTQLKYNKYSALHLAINENSIEIIQYLITNNNNNAKKNCYDNSLVKDNEINEETDHTNNESSSSNNNNDNDNDDDNNDYNNDYNDNNNDNNNNDDDDSDDDNDNDNDDDNNNSIDLELLDLQNLSPINFAINFNHNNEIIKLFLKQKINLNSKNFQNQNSLHLICINENEEILDYIYNDKLMKKEIEKIINEVDVFNKTALFYAIEKENLFIIRILLELGTNIEKLDYNLMNALHLTIKLNNSNICKLFHQNKKANVQLKKSTNIANKNLDYPIHTAVLNSNIKNLFLLLLYDADINKVNKKNQTGLHLASKKADLKMIDFLLKNGVDTNIRDDENCYSIYYICSILNKNLAYQAFSIFYNLIKFDQLNEKNGQNSLTCLHKSILNKNEKLSRLLIDIGSDVNIPNKKNETPLHLAIKKSKKISDYLIQNGANPNLMNNNQETVFSLIKNNSSYINQLSVKIHFYEKNKKNSKKNTINENNIIENHLYATWNYLDQDNVLDFNPNLIEKKTLTIDISNMLIINDIIQYIKNNFNLSENVDIIPIVQSKSNYVTFLNNAHPINFLMTFNNTIDLYNKELANILFDFEKI
ncbi:ada2a-containing complex component 3 isoform d [Anaeramoeba flamelloides]|uniref:Ada2a-containing complex component 3 isoform d n=1 Tax=Anaeramoeba flamelloides TaxID=1746091 RepID=A0AAV7ZSH9_9EUKA|nr:ada2a-containing complex component 3 isoform d [Anaeramoeba flamelloides]